MIHALRVPRPPGVPRFSSSVPDDLSINHKGTTAVYAPAAHARAPQKKGLKMSAVTPARNAVGSITVNRVRTFVDEQTGREVRQLTDFEHGAHLGYFRMFRQLPDGRMLAWARHEHGRAILIDPESGDLELLAQPPWSLKLRESDGRNWYLRSKDGEHHHRHRGHGKGNGKHNGKRRRRQMKGMQLWHIDLPGGEPVFDTAIPDDLPAGVADITIDGQCLILHERNEDLEQYPVPTTKDVTVMGHYFSRPRHGSIWAYDIATGNIKQLLTTEGLTPLHLDTSPIDPTLLRYAMDMPETTGQRV